MRVKRSRYRGRIGFAIATLVVVIAAGAFLTYHVRWLEQRRKLAAESCDLGAERSAPRALRLFFAHGYETIHLPIHNPGGGPYRLTPAEQQRYATYQRMFPEATIGHVNKAL